MRLPEQSAVEEAVLKWYDWAYGICDTLGIVRLTRRWKLEARPGCDHTIICGNAQGCGRRNCPARTLAISTYCRRIQTVSSK